VGRRKKTVETERVKEKPVSFLGRINGGESLETGGKRS